MQSSLIDKTAYREIVNLAYFGQPGTAEARAKQAVDVGEITLDELEETLERIGSRFSDSSELLEIVESRPRPRP